MKTIAAAAALLSLTCAHQNPRLPSPDLIGTWRVVEFWNQKSPDAPKQYPFGEHPIGYIVYDATGHVFVEMATNPQPSRITEQQRHALTREDALSTIEAYVAYWGTYTIDVSHGVVVHHVEGDSRREYIGTDQERPFRVTGNELRIGDGKTWLRRFIRVK